MKPDLTLAIIRYSVVCQRWNVLSAGFNPSLESFLAGWFCRVIGSEKPNDCGRLKDSFNAGWDEADSAVVIYERTIEKEEEAQ